MKYRLATIEDIDVIMAIVEDARRLLATHGSGQWQDGYPNRDTFIEDIYNKDLYVALTDGDQIAGICAIKDFELAYDHLLEGKWLSDNKYLVMHRAAVKEEYRNQGYGKTLFEIFENISKERNIKSLRVDTHEKNTQMVSLIKKMGFIYCGIAILHEDNGERLAFEKLI